MRRYRWAFAILTTLVVAAVAYAGLHAPRGDGVGNGATAELIPLDQRQPAADLAGIRGWVNSPALTLSALRGKVVLIDFWTFSCVNCVRTFPHLSALQERYAGHGLVIVGVHSPEFDFEKNAGNVAAAVRRDGVSWPVALDSDMGTWNAYGNRFWPAEYLIDRDGRVAYVHFGEGAYAETDAAVATLVGSAAAGGAAPSSAGPSTNAPEVYAGSARGVLDNQEGFGPAGEPVTYGGAGPPTAPNRLRLSGVWSDHGEYVEAVSAGHVRLRFDAARVFMVAGTARGSLEVTVTVDGSPLPQGAGTAASPGGQVIITRDDLYPIIALPARGTHVFDLTAPAGFQLFTVTFG